MDTISSINDVSVRSAQRTNQEIHRRIAGNMEEQWSKYDISLREVISNSRSTTTIVRNSEGMRYGSHSSMISNPVLGSLRETSRNARMGL